jgi:hypothetical protein
VRKLSSDDLGGGWEGLGFVVGDSVLQAVEQALSTCWSLTGLTAVRDVLDPLVMPDQRTGR